jgi:small subunit ribosomal protein S9
MPETSGTKAMEVKKPKKKSLSSEARSKAKSVGRYYEAVGRRKKAIARVRLFSSSPSQSIDQGNLLINNKPYKEYFPSLALQQSVENPFLRLKLMKRFKGTVKVKGGGPTGQAEAIRHGIARALILFDESFRTKLKKAGYLKRDPRKKERKKFGLKKARRGPQWSKR